MCCRQCRRSYHVNMVTLPLPQPQQLPTLGVMVDFDIIISCMQAPLQKAQGGYTRFLMRLPCSGSGPGKQPLRMAGAQMLSSSSLRSLQNFWQKLHRLTDVTTFVGAHMPMPHSKPLRMPACTMLHGLQGTLLIQQTCVAASLL